MSIFRMPEDQRLGRYDHLIVHCSATRRDQDFDAAWIRDLHKRQWGSKYAGYHVVIKRDGTIETFDRGQPARPFDQPGAHVGTAGPGWNTRAFGVCLIGGIDQNSRPSANFERAQFEALKDVMVAFLEAHPQPFKVTIMGHGRLNQLTGAPPKACPCFDVEEWVRQCNIWGRFRSRDTEDAPHGQDYKPNNMDVPRVHVVKSGDTLWQIANQWGLDTKTILELNSDLDPRRLRPGMEIVLWRK